MPLVKPRSQIRILLPDHSLGPKPVRLERLICYDRSYGQVDMQI
jgi:hypothetical protein